MAPTFRLKENDLAFQLVVDIPDISRKDLHVNVDFERGVIDVLGWLDATTTEASCLYQEWDIQANKNHPNYANPLDLTMVIEEGALIVSVPKPPPPPSNTKDDENSTLELLLQAKEEEEIKAGLPLNVQQGKHLRGFRVAARQNDTMTLAAKAKTLAKLCHHSDASHQYQKSKQTADFEKFLLVSLIDTDEEAYWLHKM
jgi:hypothetical protein